MAHGAYTSIEAVDVSRFNCEYRCAKLLTGVLFSTDNLSLLPQVRTCARTFTTSYLSCICVCPFPHTSDNSQHCHGCSDRRVKRERERDRLITRHDFVQDLSNILSQDMSAGPRWLIVTGAQRKKGTLSVVT